MTVRDSIDRLRQPDYTGENRCTPCTLLNVAIAAVLVAAATTVALSRTDRVGAAVLGTALAAVSGAAIYLRGYLVPGTPRLTETVLPDRVHRRLETRPSGVDDDASVDLALKGIGATRSADDERPPAEDDRRTVPPDENIGESPDSSDGSYTSDDRVASEDGSSSEDRDIETDTDQGPVEN
ncbi:hypothetical protein [Halostagnicola kamekurae]|uniref:DUF8054 domain-containing protein n=1 Tax=Halostagnicola kamekurae TaxID=619731 RepID=A0A1I6RZ43_9EURY|nr:hypothetical protein [Halostagnicola kamekurae]SFS69967.1 hypothetical protein SAMN04488556_2326 [Halostagnicola kamekurae]